MKRVVEVELKDAGESLTVTYDQDALINAAAESAPKAILGGIHEETSATFDALSDAMVSWDLINDDGRPYPLDRESLSHLPIFFLYTVSRAIWAEAFERDN
jgi:hypothetical protein